MLNSKQLQHFLAIIEHGSMGRAAKVLHLSEPALSKSIRLLEASLKIKLFDRGTRGLEVTVFGDALRERAKSVMAEMRRAEDDLLELRSASVGHVYVGAGPSFTATFLPQAIAKARCARPGVKMSVVEGYCDTLLPKVIQGELDFAMVTLDAHVADAELCQEKLWENDAVLLVRPNHPLARRTDVTPHDIHSADWILMKRPDLFRLKLESLFAAEGLEPPRPSIECASAPFLRRMLLEADTITFLPRDYVAADLADGRLVQLHIPGWVWKRPIGLIYRRRKTPSPAARVLMASLRSLFEQDPAHARQSAQLISLLAGTPAAARVRSTRR